MDIIVGDYMSSLYNKRYLEIVDLYDMQSILEGKKEYKVDATNLRERKTFIFLQHYLIDYIEKHGKTVEADKILATYFKEFLKYPHQFADSPLLKNEFINRYVPLKVRDKVLTYRDDYFNTENVGIIYNKLKSGNYLSEKEKNQLYSYLIIKLKKNEKKFESIFKYCAKYILNSNKKTHELNEMELKFYCSYIATMAGKGYDVQPDTYIMADRTSLGGEQANGIVFINRVGFCQELYQLTETICHETRHAVQNKQSTERKNKTAFEMARQKLLRRYLTTEKYKIYELNYQYVGIELDAEKSGFFDAGVFLGMLERRDLAEKLIDERKDRLDNRHLYQFGQSKEGKPISPDKFLSTYLDEVIKAHPEEIKKYPALELVYNPDGSRKPFEELMRRRMNQGIDDRGIYDCYINYGIGHGELDKIDVGKFSKEDKQSFYKSLGSVFRDKAILFGEYCDDKEHKKWTNKNEDVEKGQIITTTLYQLSLLDKIISYIDENMDEVLASKEETPITNLSFIFNFIYDFRDFDFNKIENDVIKDNPIVKERMEKFLNKSKSVIKKFNREYIKDRVKDLSIEEMHTLIKTPEGVVLSFSDYLYLDLLPRLDGHMECDIKGKRVYVSDIIRHYKKEIKNNAINKKNTSMI